MAVTMNHTHTGEHTVEVDGKLQLVRYCNYCWAEYIEPKPSRPYLCSTACVQRTRAWSQWIESSRASAIRGDVDKPCKVGPALPPAGVTLQAVLPLFTR